MRSGLEETLTDLSFKEDHAVSEQQQNLLFLHSKWTIWMVCNLQGREYCQLPFLLCIMPPGSGGPHGPHWSGRPFGSGRLRVSGWPRGFDGTMGLVGL